MSRVAAHRLRIQHDGVRPGHGLVYLLGRGVQVDALGVGLVIVTSSVSAQSAGVRRSRSCLRSGACSFMSIRSSGSASASSASSATSKHQHFARYSSSCTCRRSGWLPETVTVSPVGAVTVTVYVLGRACASGPASRQSCPLSPFRDVFRESPSGVHDPRRPDRPAATPASPQRCTSWTSIRPRRSRRCGPSWSSRGKRDRVGRRLGGGPGGVGLRVGERGGLNVVGHIGRVRRRRRGEGLVESHTGQARQRRDVVRAPDIQDVVGRILLVLGDHPDRQGVHFIRDPSFELVAVLVSSRYRCGVAARTRSRLPSPTRP